MIKIFWLIILVIVVCMIGVIIGQTNCFNSPIKQEQPISKNIPNNEISISDYKTVDAMLYFEPGLKEIVKSYLNDDEIIESEYEQLRTSYKSLREKSRDKRLKKIKEDIKVVLEN